jgi:hypothetical protein
MSQRHSEYDRIASDDYATPPWVTRIIIPHIPTTEVWECAAGDGKMVRVMRKAGLIVRSTTLSEKTGRGNFLTATNEHDHYAIVTNPPYSLAQEFVEHALDLAPFVAMLLPSEWDTAKGREHLFGACGRFHKKIVITQRIRWIVGSKGSPSANHAWFIWHQPTLRPGPSATLEYWYP